jgi:hypothetical protein
MQLKNLLAVLQVLLLIIAPALANVPIPQGDLLMTRQSVCPNGELDCAGVCYDPTSGEICCGSGKSHIL